MKNMSYNPILQTPPMYEKPIQARMYLTHDQFKKRSRVATFTRVHRAALMRMAANDQLKKYARILKRGSI
jgi:hypothetical protein